MDINGNSSSVIDSVMRTVAPEAAAASRAPNPADASQSQDDQQPVASASEPVAPARPATPDHESRVGQNLDVRA